MDRETYATLIETERTAFLARCWERGEAPSDEAWEADLRREALCHIHAAHKLLCEAIGPEPDDWFEAEQEASDEIVAIANGGAPFRYDPLPTLPDEFWERYYATGDDYMWTPALEAREAELRTMDYRRYLQTPEWEQQKRWALRRAEHACQTCGQGGRLHVHHRSYDRRGRESVSDLIVLCEDCHLAVHMSGGSHRPAGLSP